MDLICWVYKNYDLIILLFIYLKKKQISNIYQELAEKEQALLMAAQFGQNLIEEKEELEKQIENMKREHQNQLEVVIFSLVFLNTRKSPKIKISLHPKLNLLKSPN